MSTDVDALLVYGYDLGGPGRWNLRGVDRDQAPNFSWWNPVTGEDGGFMEATAEALQNYRRTNLDAIVGGLSVVWYGSEVKWTGFDVGYMLAATHYSSYFSHALPISPEAIVQHDRDKWDRQLEQALTILDIHPLQQEPRWLLAASHGI